MKGLLEVQSRLKAPKGNYNEFGRYKYRSCEDILEALKPLLAEHKLTLTISDDLIMAGNRYYVKATATVTDGSQNISVTAYARESEVKKGMDEAQITGSVSSYARKYALNGLFLIDDNKDPDTRDNRESKEEYHEEPKVMPKAKDIKVSKPSVTINVSGVFQDKGIGMWVVRTDKKGEGYYTASEGTAIAAKACSGKNLTLFYTVDSEFRNVITDLGPVS
jgi:hypothetical protein